MARREAAREDLMREATALRVRGEFLLPGQSDPVVAGFRDGGGCSLYCGADPCYHFNQSGQLRRAFVEGTLYRTQGETLAALRRHRTPTDTSLMRCDLDPKALRLFVDEMRSHVAGFLNHLSEQRCTLLREVPNSSGIAERLLRWLPNVVAQTQPLAEAFATRRT